MNTRELARMRRELFLRFAGDLYPGRYTAEKCEEIAEQETEILDLKREKRSTVVVHNYLYPEFHEVADRVGDSLGLSFFVRDANAGRVDFESVAFMGQTAKIITGDATRVFIPDYPEVIGCSLVFGTDYGWIEEWKDRTGGVLVTYINSSPYLKSLSEYVGTSGNFDKVVVQAHKDYPNRRILLLPDKFLGYVMKAKAIERGVPEELIEVYEFRKPVEPGKPSLPIVRTGAHWNASCIVHDAEGIPSDAIELAIVENPDAELMIHPECGCASSCMLKIQKHELPDTKAYYLSTEGMIRHARSSPNRRFLVATEKGLVYRLRKELPDREFIPVSYKASCPFMKACTFEKLLDSLKRDRIEVVFCDDCCDPKHPYQDEGVTHIQKTIAAKAKTAIERMLAVR